MRGVRRLAVVLAVIFGGAAHAVAPTARWFTLETEHFRVHFHEGAHMEALAQRIGRTAEAAHAALTPRLHWTPSRKVDVLLTDDVDSSNGSASSYLRPVMTFYAELPEDMSVLHDYDDWAWGLVVHEYSHILHLDNATGPPAWINRVFGNQLMMNNLLPRWYTEGLATYEESNLSSGGRLRSSLFDMWLRATFLEGKPFDLAETSHVPTRWPRGNLAYLYGGRFLGFIAERHGEDALARFNRGYGARLLPYALNATALDTIGEDFIHLYREWQASLVEGYARFLAPARAAGLTPVSVLTTAGQSTDHPHFSADGQRLFYLELGPDRRPAIRSMRPDGSENRKEAQLWADAIFDLSPDGKKLIFSSSEIFEEYSIFDDLYEVDLQTRSRERLSWGLRATEPAYSPDGKSVAFVARSGGGGTWLGLLTLEDRKLTRLYEPSVDNRVFTPSFSPDGGALVFSQQVDGARQLRRLNLATREVETLLGDRFMNLQPRYAGPERLLFSSDRTGIFNLYALELTSRAVRQLSNVETGAFHPDLSPDGKTLAFTHYSARGYDIATMSAQPPPLAAPLPDRPPRPPPQYRDDPKVTYPVAAYNPLPSLLPQYWVPLLVSDPRGLAVGLETSGSDIVGRHAWALTAAYGLTSHEPAASLEYQAHVVYPLLGASVSTYTSQAPGFRTGFYDRQYAFTADASFPYDTLDSSMSVGISYEWRYLDPHYDVHLEPDQPAPLLPRRGSIGALALSWNWSNARRYAYSISAEEGHSLAFSVRKSTAVLGGTFEFAAVDARYQTYLALPWLKHHVAALRVAVGAAIGDVGNRPLYSLGGISLNDPVLQLFRNQRAGSGFLRGYPPSAFAGNTFALGTLEYRFPIADLNVGVDTLPLFFRRISGSVFTDVGTVGQEALQLGPLRPSVGVELKTELTAVYALGAELRLGLARGLSFRGIWDVYLSVGSTF